MKKILLLTTVAVAMIFTGCGNGSIKSLPEDLREVVEEADKEVKADMAQAREKGQFKEFEMYGFTFDYEGVCVEGRDIIFIMKVDGEPMKEISIKNLTAAFGITQETFEAAIRSGEIFSQENNFSEIEAELIDLLQKYEYNIAFRIKGHQSDDEVTWTIPYDVLSKQKKESDPILFDFDSDDEDFAIEWDDDEEVKEYLIQDLENACAMGDYEAAMAIVDQIDSNYDITDFNESQIERLNKAAQIVVNMEPKELGEYEY